jgi:hypothetical protein
MKNYKRLLLILVVPFLLMILVNEFMRTTLKDKPYSISGITAMNSAVPTKEKCNWNCHNNTKYCKQHHVKLVKPYFNVVDPVYFGMIGLLASTGNYGLANIIFLVILWPLFMAVLLAKVINGFLKK